MPSIKFLQTHFREESLGQWNIILIDVSESGSGYGTFTNTSD